MSATPTRPIDEAYIVDLCDDVLGMKALRGHRFSFLLGDPDKRGTRRSLPVDAYYQELRLVVEYHERQHSEAVPFFDKRIVALGLTRGEQRKKYDTRRREVLPLHGITLLEFGFHEFEFNSSKRLRRVSRDRDVVRARLAPFLSPTGKG
jgi:very-short-patch-repair endonuclease